MPAPTRVGTGIGWSRRRFVVRCLGPRRHVSTQAACGANAHAQRPAFPESVVLAFEGSDPTWLEIVPPTDDQREQLAGVFDTVEQAGRDHAPNPHGAVNP